MRTLFKIVLFSYIFLLIYPYSTSAQQTEKKIQKNVDTINEVQEAHYHIDKTGLIEISQKDPKQVDAQMKAYEIENILNFLSSQVHDVSHFTFVGRTKKDTKTFAVDSLLPEFKLRVDAFIKKAKAKTGNSDDEYNRSAKAKAIVEKIQTEGQKPKAQRSQVNEQQIYNSIIALPNSSEKVSLLLSFAGIKLRNETYYNDVTSYCATAEKITETIKDLDDQGKAYSEIARFAYNYGLDDIAVQMYFLSMESFTKFTKDTTTALNHQSIILNKLGELFSSIEFGDAQVTAAQYFQTANYYYNQTKRFLDAGDCYMRMIATDTYLMTNFPEVFDSYYNGIPNNYDQRVNDLLALKEFQIAESQGKPHTPSSSYMGYWSIAHLLEGKKKYKDALMYNLQALCSASNESQLRKALNAVSFDYSMLGNGSLQKGYDDLALYLAKEMNDQYEEYDTYLNIANHFSLLKKYDSTLFYLNRIQFDTTLKHSFYPYFYYDIMDRMYQLKYDALDSIKSDSTRNYKDNYVDAVYNKLRRLSNLNETITYARSAWNIRLNNKIITILKDSVNNLKGLMRLLVKAKEYLTDTITNLKDDTARLSKLNRNYTDSLLKKQKAINGLDLSIAKLNKEVDAANNELKLALYGIAAIAVLAIVLLRVLFIVRKEIKSRRNENQTLIAQNNVLQEQKKELQNSIKEAEGEAERILKENAENNFKLKLEKSQTEVKLFSALAINHDISKFIPCLPEAIEDSINANDKSRLIEVVKKLEEYYLKILGTNDSLTNSIKEEIDLAQISSELYQYLSGDDSELDIITNFNGNEEIENLQIPKHMLVGFIANSVKHGSDNTEKITIAISAKKRDSNFEFTIEDNGSGFESLNLHKRSPNRGINLILKQVKFYNENDKKFKILFGPEDIANKDDNSGVIVRFKLMAK